MSLWLFGAEGAAEIRSGRSAGAPAPGSLTLPDGGLTVLRRGGCRTLFDHGPHGYLTLAAHGHADALAIDIALHEQPLVSDPGVGSYFAQPGSPCCVPRHRVPCDGDRRRRDSSEPGGPFLWTTHAQQQAPRFRSGRRRRSPSTMGTHASPIRCCTEGSRAVGETGTVLVVDRLQAVGSHRYSQRWPFHPALDVAEQGLPPRPPARRTGWRHASLRGAGRRRGQPRARARKPSARVVVGQARVGCPGLAGSDRSRGDGTVELATLVMPFVGEAPSVDDIELRLESRDDGTVITIEPDGQRIELDLASPTPTVTRVRLAATA